MQYMVLIPPLRLHICGDLGETDCASCFFPLSLACCDPPCGSAAWVKLGYRDQGHPELNHCKASISL